MKINAETIIPLNVKQIPQLFNLISENPTLYKMDSHEGFEVKKGSLTEEGSTFTTKEMFAGVKIELEFEVTKTNPQEKFEFKVKNYFQGKIKGAFEYNGISDSKVSLILRIFNNPKNSFIQNVSILPVFLFPIRNLVKKQIEKEVEMIKNIAAKQKSLLS
jgi:hypothetical protein